MTRHPLVHPDITQDVIGAFYKVYNVLGYGFQEYAYKRALAIELRRLGHEVASEFVMPVHYEGELLCEQRIDLLIDGRVVVEVKCTERLAPTAARQTLNYLRVAGLPVGVLLHFGPEPKFFPVVNGRSSNAVGRPDSDVGGSGFTA